MFAETPFDVSDDDKVSHSPAGESGDATHAFGRGALIRLHRPGEKEFSCVAGTLSDRDAMYDARCVNGDSWVSNECHCVRCETVRVGEKFLALRTQPTVVVLLDLDNYGFNQLKSAPPRRHKANADPMEHIFIWAFFGSCFTRYYGTFPDTESLSQGGVRSVWSRLIADGRCHLTPCGGQQQAADGVVVQIAHAMTHVPVVILSGDRGLLRAVKGTRERVVGKKSQRMEEEDKKIPKATATLDVIDVHACGKHFLPVWEALEERVRRILGQIPSKKKNVK